MILPLRYCHSVTVKNPKRAKGQIEATKQSVLATREVLLLFCKSCSDTVHGLRSNNKNRSNRNISKRSSRHLKMVGRVIRLRASLRPPTDNEDNKGTADDDNIVRQTKSSTPSMSRQHKNRRRRMITPSTNQISNDKRIIPPEPHEDITTTTKQLQRRDDNNTGNNNKIREKSE